ncbi:MAG: hypothetical protein ACTSRU_07135 [Candidatus Hodarchaeales archaeon]
MVDWDCIDCTNQKVCEMTGMNFCKINRMPSWMARSEFYDSELGKCKHHSPVKERN